LQNYLGRVLDCHTATEQSAQTATLASPRVVKLAFISAVVFISLSLILAAGRIPKGVASILGPLRSYKPSSASSQLSRPLVTSTMAPARYTKPPQAPPVFTGTPESVIADTKRLIEHSRKLQDKLVAEIKPEEANFKNAILPQARLGDEDSLEANILCFYSAVSTDKALRDASTDAEKLFADFGIESNMREDVFKLSDAAWKAEKGKLYDESWRLLDKDRKSYIRYGLGIPEGPKRDRFKEIKTRLSEISIKFQKRLNEENGALWFSAEELHGVPKDLVDNFPKGEGEHAGKVKVSFKYPDLFPVLKYATNADVRKQMFIANENKCNDNVPLFQETVLLRDEAARLLGYPNHAAFVIEEKMLKTPKAVDDFLGDLRERLAPGGLKEIEVLKALKKSDMETRGDANPDDHYYLWDHRYYDTLMLQKEYQLDQEQIAEYFPLSTTIAGMLKIFEELFGMAFVEIVGESRDAISPSGNGSDIVWHPDVQVFSVWDSEDEGSGFIGYLYLDLYPRDGKYGHAANFGLQPGYIKPDGTRRYPATSLVCNFSKPTPKKPSLLKHDEVVTLFHELGVLACSPVVHGLLTSMQAMESTTSFLALPTRLSTVLRRSETSWKPPARCSRIGAGLVTSYAHSASITASYLQNSRLRTRSRSAEKRKKSLLSTFRMS